MYGWYMPWELGLHHRLASKRAASPLHGRNSVLADGGGIPVVKDVRILTDTNIIAFVFGIAPDNGRKL